MQGKSVAVGLYDARSNRLVDISGCPIQHPEVNRIMQEVRGIIERLGIRIYSEKDTSGSIRTIVARVSASSGKAQLTIVTATDHLPLRDRIIAQVRSALPNVITIAQSVNPGKMTQVFGEVTRILWGREQLDESLGHVKVSLSPRSFFQLNPEQTVKLHDYVQEAADLTGQELVVDAYCGTGTIGLGLAPLAREVRGIGPIAEATEEARRNAERSGCSNASFYRGRAEELLPQWVREGLQPDIVVLHPPRTGCDARLMSAITETKPRRLIYVSSNPTALAKDCNALSEIGYSIEWVQPVDMSPQTSQIECVVKLNKIEKAVTSSDR
jgi:23S rRNA (uracil1939-C5)-methyltransferase